MEKIKFQLCEAAYGFPEGNPHEGKRIDRDRGILRGPIKVLGLRSPSHNREYLPSAVKSALPLLEGAATYIDHPSGKTTGRSVRDRFGRLHGVYQDENGEAWANEFRFNPCHHYANEFAWLVENDPKGIGFSINGDGEGYRDPKTNRAVCDKINKLYSVDFVDGPGTVGGLFEQGNNVSALTDPAANGDAMNTTTGADEGDHKDALVSAIAQLADELKSGSCDHATAKTKITNILKMLKTEEKEPEEKVEGEGAGPIVESLCLYPDATVRWAGRELKRIRLDGLIEQKLNAAKLPAVAITEPFRMQLREAADPKRIDAIIADRAALAAKVANPAPTDKGKKPTSAAPEKPLTKEEMRVLEQGKKDTTPTVDTKDVNSYLDRINKVAA